ncbi:hypothetical protein FQN49_003924 [Arthroderma sp. PD_2]|nr:hypothetical protein FQN49_003924 [Arthroderma sp. PD_2]
MALHCIIILDNSCASPALPTTVVQNADMLACLTQDSNMQDIVIYDLTTLSHTTPPAHTRAGQGENNLLSSLSLLSEEVIRTSDERADSRGAILTMQAPTFAHAGSTISAIVRELTSQHSSRGFLEPITAQEKERKSWKCKRKEEK